MRNDIIKDFDKKNFRYKNSESKTKEEKSGEELKEYINVTFAFIERKSKDINNDLFAKFFNFLKPIDLAKKFIK